MIDSKPPSLSMSFRVEIALKKGFIWHPNLEILVPNNLLSCEVPFWESTLSELVTCPPH